MKSPPKSNGLKTLIRKPVLRVIVGLKNHISKPEDEADYIHHIRVDIKRLRAWLRLLKIDHGDYDWHKSDQCLREISHDMGQTRNNEVIHQVLQRLHNKNKGVEERAVIINLQQMLPLDAGLSKADWEEIKQRINDELEIIKDILISYDFSSEQIQNGIKYTYQKIFYNGKKAFSKNGGFDDLHNLRKWMKYLNYQLGYIYDAYPEINFKYIKLINKLGDRLGQINDLVMLKNALQQINLNEDDHKTLKNLIDKSLKKQIKRVEQSYKSIFSHHPGKILDQLNIFTNHK
jgi:CHAD domain-containing protein